jgi:aminoglycoside/choline kinase family phosphotransferase
VKLTWDQAIEKCIADLKESQRRITHRDYDCKGNIVLSLSFTGRDAPGVPATKIEEKVPATT